MKYNHGFTLIETLIYIALFGIIIGGVSVCVYTLISASGHDQTGIMLEQEGDFLLGKLSWALADGYGLTVGVDKTSFSVNKYNFTDNSLAFDFHNGNLRLTQGASGAENLNNSSTRVENLVFQDLPAQNGQPEGLSASFVVTARASDGKTVSQNFQMT